MTEGSLADLLGEWDHHQAANARAHAAYLIAPLAYSELVEDIERHQGQLVDQVSRRTANGVARRHGLSSTEVVALARELYPSTRPICVWVTCGRPRQGSNDYCSRHLSRIRRARRKYGVAA